MKKLTLLLISSFLLSCNSNTVYKKPNQLIPEDQMIMILKDIYIANAAKTRPNINKEVNVNYLRVIYKKYKIDSVSFNESLAYYNSRLEENEKLIDKVVKSLQEDSIP